MNTTERMVLNAPMCDIARRCLVVRCPRCDEPIYIPVDTGYFSWIARHIEDRLAYNGIAESVRYHTIVLDRYLYALPSGELILLWLPRDVV